MRIGLSIGLPSNAGTAEKGIPAGEALAYNVSTVLDDQASGGWTAVSGATVTTGAALSDPMPDGSATCVQCVVPASDTFAGMEKAITGTLSDYEQIGIVLNNPNDLASGKTVAIEFRTDAAGTKRRRFTFGSNHVRSGPELLLVRVDGTAAPGGASWDDFGTGMLPSEQFTHVRVIGSNTSAQPQTLQYTKLVGFKERPAVKPMLLFNFEGNGFQSHIDIALPKMQANNMLGFLSGDVFNASPIDIDTLYDEGWDYLQSGRNKNYATTPGDLNADFQDGQLELIGQGYLRGSDMFAFPGNNYAYQNLGVLRTNGVTFAKADGPVDNNVSEWGEMNSLAMSVFVADNPATLPQLQAWLDNIITLGGVGVIQFRELVESAPGAFQQTRAIFEGFVDYAKIKVDAQDLQVVTPTQYLDGVSRKEAVSLLQIATARNFLFGESVRDKMFANINANPPRPSDDTEYLLWAGYTGPDKSKGPIKVVNRRTMHNSRHNNTEYVEGAFNWSVFDQYYDEAETRGQPIRFHVGPWHLAVPSWWTNGANGPARAQAYVEAFIAHAKAKGGVYAYDICNEMARRPESGGLFGHLRPQPDMFGATYDYRPLIRDWFVYAKSEDPAAELRYNDYFHPNSWAEQAGHRQAILDLVDYLVNTLNTPIDGVGIQGHLFGTADDRPSWDLTASAQFLTDLGALVENIHISEFDVRDRLEGTIAERDAYIATLTKDFFDLVLANKKVKTVDFWGSVSDRYGVTDTYTPGRPDGLPENPMPYGRTLQRKPLIYAAARDAFMDAPADREPVKIQPPVGPIANQTQAFGEDTPEGYGGVAPVTAGTITAFTIDSGDTNSHWQATSAGELTPTAAGATAKLNGGPYTLGCTATILGTPYSFTWTINVETQTISFKPNPTVGAGSELDVIMATGAAVSGKTIKGRAGEQLYENVILSNRGLALTSMTTITSHDTTAGNRFWLTASEGRQLRNPMNLRFLSMGFRWRFIKGTSDPTGPALGIRTSSMTADFIVDDCDLDGGYKEAVQQYGEPTYTGDYGYRGLLGINADTTALDQTGLKFVIENNRIYNNRRALNMPPWDGQHRIRKNLFWDNITDDSLCSAADNANLVDDPRYIIEMNECDAPLDSFQHIFTVTNVDVANQRMTVDRDDVVSPVNIFMNFLTDTLPSGLDYINRYTCTIHSQGGGETVLQWPVAFPFTDTGTAVRMQTEPGHPDFFQFVGGPGVETGGQLFGCNFMYGRKDRADKFGQSIFMDDNSGSGNEGKFWDLTAAWNWIWGGVKHGLWQSNSWAAFVNENTILAPNDTAAADLPFIHLSASFGFNANSGICSKNIVQSIPYTSMDNGVQNNNIFVTPADYATTSQLSTWTGVDPTTLEEFKARTERNDLDGILTRDGNGKMVSYDIPSLNQATIPQFVAASGPVSTVVEGAPVQITAVQGSEGQTSTQGIRVGIAGPGAPQYRITSDLAGNTVIHDWTNVPLIAQNNHYAWPRLTADATVDNVRTAYVRIGRHRRAFAVTATAASGFPVVEGIVGSTELDFDGSCDVALPAGIVAGEKIIVCIRSNIEQVVAPVGQTWTQEAYEGTNGHKYVFSRVADGTEGTSAAFTLTNNGITAQVAIRLSNAGAIEVAETASLDPPNLTLAGGSAQAQWIAFSSTGRSTPDVTDAPANYINLTAQSTGESSSSGHCSIGVATRELEAASEDPGAFTWENEGSVSSPYSFTIAVLPA